MTRSIRDVGDVTEVVYTDTHRHSIEQHVVEHVDPQAAALVAPGEAVGFTYTTATAQNTSVKQGAVHIIDPLSLPGDGVVRTRNNTMTPFTDGVDQIVHTERL